MLCDIARCCWKIGWLCTHKHTIPLMMTALSNRRKTLNWAFLSTSRFWLSHPSIPAGPILIEDSLWYKSERLQVDSEGFSNMWERFHTGNINQQKGKCWKLEFNFSNNQILVLCSTQETYFCMGDVKYWIEQDLSLKFSAWRDLWPHDNNSISCFEHMLQCIKKSNDDWNKDETQLDINQIIKLFLFFYFSFLFFF